MAYGLVNERQERRFPLLLLGSAQLGLNYGVVREESPSESDETVFSILSKAYREGFGGIDTAMAYGDAPRRIGVFLDRSPAARGSWRVCTKLSLNHDTETNTLEDSWKKHIHDLNCPTISALLLHRSADVYDDGVRSFCLSLRNNGSVERLGVSVYSPEEIAVCSRYGFAEAVEIPLNAFSFPKWENSFTEIRESFVIARSVFLQGVLVCGADSFPESVNHLSAYIRRFQEICASFSFTPLEGAFAVVSSFPWISAITVGVDSVAQLREVVAAYRNVQAKSVVLALSEFLVELRRLAGEIPENAIDPRFWKG